MKPIDHFGAQAADLKLLVDFALCVLGRDNFVELKILLVFLGNVDSVIDSQELLTYWIWDVLESTRR